MLVCELGLLDNCLTKAKLRKYAGEADCDIGSRNQTEVARLQ